MWITASLDVSMLLTTFDAAPAPLLPARIKLFTAPDVLSQDATMDPIDPSPPVITTLPDTALIWDCPVTPDDKAGCRELCTTTAPLTAHPYASVFGGAAERTCSFVEAIEDSSVSTAVAFSDDIS